MLSDSMSEKLDGVHVGFLWKVTGKKKIMQKDGSWQRAE